MGAGLEQQPCVIGNSGGPYLLHAPLPEWPSLVVSIEHWPHVVTCSHNKPASTHRYQPVSTPGLLHKEPWQYRQTKLHPSRVWT